jgi:imidazoleglycerol-phosphate dehydratase / histidinol-phosphatase
MQKILFLDRDGVLIYEPKDDPQIDKLHKLKFVKGLFSNLSEIYKKMDYKLVMVTNQDGLGTPSYSEVDFNTVQQFILDTLDGEGIHFDEICVDRSFESDKSPTRKPGIGMLTKYLTGAFDLENSIVIGDRITDIQLAKNLGTKAIRINGSGEIPTSMKDDVLLDTNTWDDIRRVLFAKDRMAVALRTTSETKISGRLNLDGTGISNINTGLGFFDHMLEQIAKHGALDLELTSVGDLHIDEHHTIEDTAIVLGTLFYEALGKKAGIQRYGYAIPMDDSNAEVLLDFGGRPWIEWNVKFKREKIGEMPTEMFFHFFKSFSDHAKCNLNIKAKGKNEHHKIEAIFKAFALAIKMAKQRNGLMDIPSTKGVI